MDPALQSLADIAIYFVQTYIIPSLITLVIAFMAVAFGISLVHRRADYLLRTGVKAEMATDMRLSDTLVEYAEKQLTSDPSVQPMPRFHVSAYREYKKAGLLAKLASRKRNSVEELERLYLCMESVNEAGRRQEDLAFGPSAAYPNAHNLRLENLTYIHDTTHNIIKPYYERMQNISL
jgi:hypothetical protein